nr:DUF4116 domain-containing protein [Gammaproteobacteria bacterium]
MLGIDATKTSELSKEIEAARSQLEQAEGAFKAFFYLQDKEGVVHDVNWSNLKGLFWESINKQAYFEMSPDEVNYLEIILNPGATEAQRTEAVIGFLSHPENKQDIEPILSALKLPDARVSEILIALWGRSETKEVAFAHRLLSFVMTNHPEIYSVLCEAFQVDAEAYLMTVLARNGMLLQHAPNDFRGNQAVVLAAIQQNWRALQFASDRLKDDRDFMLAAVAQNWRALEYASDRLKDDQDVVLAAVAQDWMALEDASDRLKDDRDVVLAAVAQNGYALTFASAELKDDRDFVLAAVAQDWMALEYASDRLKD